MTVEELIAALEGGAPNESGGRRIGPDTRYIEDDLVVYESRNFVVREVRLVGGEVVVA